MKAADIMTRDVITVDAEMSVQELCELLVNRRISGAPVCDTSGNLIGVVTEADVLTRPGLTVRDIMTPDVVSVQPETPVDEIAWLLASRNFRRVAVVEGEKLIGVVSRADIVRTVGTAPQLRDQVVRYVIDKRGLPYWTAVEIAEYVEFSRVRRRRPSEAGE